MEQPPGTIRPEDYRQIREIFESALSYRAGDRVAFVERACSGDTRLISEVQRMLAADERSYPLLDEDRLAGQRFQEGDGFANHFKVTGILGRGGMGEVYRARDTNLNREVAIKVLPAAFTRDPDRLARLRREAQVLASINHPNIGAIYSFEESEWAQALTLELVEGPTLAERIAQGPVPIEEAVPIARQIAVALEAAHEQGIVHRDLKPANVKLRPDGEVKVLDFGLAKALQTPDPATTEAAEITSPAMLALGLMIGTPAYMSPEQARGRTADKRADIWAFGAVLYEMLAGKRAFRGEDVADTLASVLRQEIDWNALPSTTPEAIRNLIARCLDRDPKQRLRDIGEARIVLDRPSVPMPAEPSRKRFRAGVLALVTITALVAGVAWYVPRKTSPPFVSRFLITTPPDQPLNFPMSGYLLAISPDGKQVVYAANESLYLRLISEFVSQPISGTENLGGVMDPVFSPDGKWIAFFVQRDQTIRKISVSGGVPVTICKATILYGVHWGSTGIHFGQAGKGIMHVSPEGGEPKVVVRTGEGELAHGPDVLPDGRGMLFSLTQGNTLNRWQKAHVVLLLPSGERKMLIEGGSDPRYLPTGHLVYVRNATLLAAPFDIRTGALTGGAVPVIDGILRSGQETTGAVQISYSRTGDLAYVPGPDNRSKRWFVGLSDRNGKIDRLNIPVGRPKALRISPNGARIAFSPALSSPLEDPGIVWIYDVSGTKAIRRLTYTGANRFPIWTSDSSRVVFQSDRDGDLAIYWQRADGTSEAERLTRPEKGTAHVPESWSPRGDTLLYSVDNESELTLWTLSLKTGKSTRFGNVRSVFPTGARFSPDGRWIAYAVAEQAGPTTIYVQPFPATGAKYELFVKSGNYATPHKPLWSVDGKELIYVPRFAEFEAVRVTTRPEFAFGNAALLKRSFNPGPPNSRTLYDISPDGRFVGLFDADQPGLVARPREIAVVLNWFEELRARVPAP